MHKEKNYVNNIKKEINDDEFIEELFDLIKSYKHKFFFNRDNELKLGKVLRINFDKDSLLQKINTSKNVGTEVFPIDFFLSVNNLSYKGQLMVNFGDEIDEHNEKELYCNKDILFDKECPYEIKIAEFYVNHDNLLSKDSYIELFIIEKKKTNLMKQAIVDKDLNKYKKLLKELIDESWCDFNIKRLYDITIDTCNTYSINSDSFVEVFNKISRQ